MSFESALHLQMVRQIVREVAARHGDLYSLVILADLTDYGRNKPMRVGGYVPDVFAIDAPETCRIIGEAKTPGDFETERSQRQVSAFLSHLATAPRAYFYLAVPWVYASRAGALLNDLINASGAQAVTTSILRGL
jgi:hypothetical protein